MSKKYEILNDSTNILNLMNISLHRIRALQDFGSVSKGEIGGYVEKEENLDQQGNAWISEDAKVYSNAFVSDNAQIYGNARIYGDSLVYENASVYGFAKVCGDAIIYGNAKVFGYSWIYDKSKICGNAEIFGYAIIAKSFINGEDKIYGNPLLYQQS